MSDDVEPVEPVERVEAEIGQTMIYVHVAENHRRDVPPAVMEARHGRAGPGPAVLKMLGPVAKPWQRPRREGDENLAILVS